MLSKAPIKENMGCSSGCKDRMQKCFHNEVMPISAHWFSIAASCKGEAVYGPFAKQSRIHCDGTTGTDFPIIL